MPTRDGTRHPQLSSITRAAFISQWVLTFFASTCGNSTFLAVHCLFLSACEGNSLFQQPRASPRSQYKATCCPLHRGDPSQAGWEVLGPLRRAAGAALLCILPPCDATHPCAGEGEGFGDIFSYDTFEISPLISMPGRAPFCTHPLLLSFARRLTVPPFLAQSCLSA